MLPERQIVCPYCGEQFTAFIDVDGEGQQTSYIEDCPVCCRPIEFNITADDSGEIILCEVHGENE